MSEVTTEQEAPTPPPSQAEVWERVTKPSEISTEDVSGKKEETAEATKPDRDLVAPKIKEFLQSKPQEEPQVAEEPKTENEQELDKIDIVLQKLKMLEEKELTAEQERQRAEEEAKFLALRDGVVANIEAEKDAYPGLLALNQQDTLVQLLVSRLQEGQDVSEAEVASEIEAKCRETWEKLNAIYAPAPSKEEAPRKAEPKQTITNNLVSSDSPIDLTALGPKDAQAELWEALKNR